MSFSVRTHDVIRAAILADWRSRYLAKGNDLDTEQDSDAWCWADAVAFQVEGLEAKALALTKEIFPDTASSAFLERHAALIGLSRKSATAAVLIITVTGTNGSTWATSDKLTAADGTVYKPTSAGSIVSGGQQTGVLVQAQSTGASTNKASGTLLTWSPAPAGINSTAAVTGVSVVAVDQETDAALAQRVLAWWTERPGGGNRADWVDWGTSYSGVASAFVYPLRHFALGNNTLGALTLCVLAAPPTLQTLPGNEPAESATRFVPLGADGVLGTLADLGAKIYGTGTHASEGGLMPANAAPIDIAISTGTALAQGITLALTLSSGYVMSFTGTVTLTSGSSPLLLKGAAALPGSLGIGDWIAVPDVAVRGGFAYRQVTNITGNDITIGVALNNAPGSGAVVRPLPQLGTGATAVTNAHSIRAAILALIDSLGPGANTAPSLRWPPDGTSRYPATLYRSAVTAAVMGIPGLAGAPAGVTGVASVVVTLVASPDPEARVPLALEVVTLGTLTLA